MAAFWHRWKYCIKCRYQGIFGSHDGADQTDAHTSIAANDARCPNALGMEINQKLAYRRYPDPHPNGLRRSRQYHRQYILVFSIDHDPAIGICRFSMVYGSDAGADDSGHIPLICIFKIILPQNAQAQQGSQRGGKQLFKGAAGKPAFSSAHSGNGHLPEKKGETPGEPAPIIFVENTAA